MTQTKQGDNKIADSLSRKVVIEIQTSFDQNDRTGTSNKSDQFYTEINQKMQENRLFQQRKEYKIYCTQLL